MKKTLIIAFILFAIQAKSQTKKPIDSFLGVKFGSSAAQVIAGLKLKGATVDQAHSNPTFLVFNNVSLGRRKASIFYVRLVDNKAYQATFLFDQEIEAKAIDYYNDLVADINDVYGTGKSYKTFKSPYEDGDGYEITAIKTGKAEYTTYWIDENAISAEINTDVAIKLTYQDSNLIKLAVQKQKDKDKSDF